MWQLRFHFGERDRDGDGPLDAAVMDACARRGVAAAALLRGVEGFGAKHRLRTDRLLTLSEDAPLVAVAVGETREIEALADEVREMASGGLVVLESVAVVDGGAVGDRGTRTNGTTTSPAEQVVVPVVGAPGDEGEGLGGAPGDGEEGAPNGGAGGLIKATIWGPRTGSASPHLGAVAAFKRHGAASATVLLGVDGVLDGERRRARLVAGNTGVPAMTVAVGERTAIYAALADLDGATHLVTVGGVEPKLRIEPPSLHGDATRVTLVTSEIAACESHPLYVELIRRLRTEGATGATALRGVWGFRGDGEPHGDRVLALRRDVPLVVETVDTPERAARWRELALDLAGDQGHVYSEAITGTFALEEP
jgi:PII-like signaling protein